MPPAPPDLLVALQSGLGVLLAVALLALLLTPRRGFDRVLMAAVTTPPILIYLHWRYTQTLPPYDFAFEPLWARLFFAFEALSIFYSLGAVLITLRNSEARVKAQADAAEAALTESGEWPAVDVLICTYNEPLAVLEKSILTALALDYPPGRATIWVLDDTRRAWLRDYCAEVGARYITRADNRAAKAGNLNNGWRVTAGETNAPLLLVLDADFAPQRRMLRRMVGLFDDPRVGIVQTPQFYYNPDPIQHNLGVTAAWVDDQRMFFDLFQPAKDAWGCAFCVGTGFIVRRDLLDRLGGFPEGAVSEDIYLTYGLMRHGYQTRWLNERLSIGLSAENIGEYCTQRARWCLGTIQVALLADGPMRGKGYTLNQRLHYLHGLLHWFGKPFLPLLLVAPAIYWLFGIPAFQTDHVEFVHYGLPALVCFWLHSGWISRGRSLPIFTEASHAVAALPVSVALASALLRPFGRPFKVTAKGSSSTGMRFNSSFALGFGAIVVANLGGIAWSLLAPGQPAEVPAEDMLNILWASIAILLALVCLLVSCELPRPRAEERFEVHWPTRLWLDAPGGPPVAGVRFCDISAGGARLALLEGTEPLVAGRMIWCEVPDIGALGGRVVRSMPGGLLGLRWEMSPAERRSLIAAIFSRAPENLAGTGDFRRALLGLGKRARNPDGRG